MNKPSLLFVFAFLLSIQVIGQDALRYIQTGNKLFEEKEYYNAIEFYKKALNQEGGDQAFAFYQLGECYRFLFDYASAEYNYQRSDDLNDRRYPLAKFQYASMLKQNGKYERALPNFEKFIEVIASYFDDNELYRNYYNQAKNEREGCILALNALSTPKPDYNLQELGSPVNTDDNDFAPAFYGSEKEIYVTSSKKSKKGAILDSRLGESYTDIYGYTLSGGKWSPLKGKGLPDDVVNTKGGEGSGVFNKEKTIYYYTNCAEDKPICAIYYTMLKDGKWSEPKRLNRSINAPGSITKHPALSPNGDTLYFVSDRTGGFGESDIWMSFSSNGINWSDPKNLGKEINTPFREIAPFFDPIQNKLFFSSNGHRGFGGFDLYLANGISLEKTEVYNLGYPFNSNKDDSFIIFGKTNGYLSSNRIGGPGKFDIYGFNIKSDKEVIAEISFEGAIAGRNAMFTDDLQFENSNVSLIKDLVSIALAAKLQEVELVLPSTLQRFYNNLSEEDKGRVERIVNSRYKRVTEQELEELDLENEYFFMTSSRADQEHIRHMATKYLEEAGLSNNIDYDSVDQAFLNILSPMDQLKVEQFILNKAKRAKEYKITAEKYDQLDKKDKTGVDKLTEQLFIEKRSLEELTLSMDNNMYLRNLDVDKRNDVVESIREKMLSLAENEKFKLTATDKEFYNNLSEDHLESIKHIANSFLLSDAEHLSQYLAKEDLEYYNLLGTNQRTTVDRIIAKIINNTYLSDMFYTESSPISKNDIKQLQDDISGANSLNDMLASVNPNSIASSLNSRDKNRLLRFLTSGGAKNYLQRKENVFTMEKDIVTQEYAKLKEKNTQETNSRIFPASFGQQLTSTGSNENDEKAAALEASKKSYTQGLEISSIPTDNVTELDQEVIDFYEAFNNLDRLKIDRFIAARYINKDYQKASLINSDLDFEKSLDRDERSHIKLLSKKLKEDALNNAEKDAIAKSFIFYNNKATNAKPKWNRLILSYALDINQSGSYLAKRKDYAFYQSMSDKEKGYIAQIESFRNLNHKILTESLREDASNVVTPNLVRNIPSYIVKSPKMSIEGELIDNQDGKAVKSFSVALENKGGKKVYQTNTNDKGEFAFRSINSDEYRLVSADKKYAEKFNKDYFIKDLKLTEIEVDDFSKITNTVLFFDSDSKSLRNEALVILDEVVSEYKKSRFLIELDSHTDDEGNKEYNEALSLSRGSSVKEFLVNKGVDNSDIVLRFFGSDKPVAPNDNVYGKQFNRRVDITIKSGTGLQYNPAVVYLAQPTADFKKLADRYKISESNLMKLNGLSKAQLTPYKPVRLPNVGISPDLSQVVPLNTSVMTFVTYKVGSGETVTSIADKLRIPEELLYELNNLKGDNLPAGSEIIVIQRSK